MSRGERRIELNGLSGPRERIWFELEWPRGLLNYVFERADKRTDRY